MVIGSFLFFPCNTEEFRCKIPGYAKKFQIKVGFVLIGVNAESKSSGKYSGFIIIIYILIFSGSVLPVN